MGTRGLMGFTVQEEHFLTYNHYDSYPTGLGSNLLKWLKLHLVIQDDTVQISPEVMGVLTGLEQVEEGSEPTEEQLAKLTARGFTEAQNVSTGRDFYSWLRDCQGDLDLTLRSGFWIKGGYEFGFDSLFCEWGYVIDVDRNCFDTYRGFQQVPATKGIWAGAEMPGSRDGYEAIQRIQSLPFDAIPDLEIEPWVTDLEDSDEE